MSRLVDADVYAAEMKNRQDACMEAMKTANYEEKQFSPKEYWEGVLGAFAEAKITLDDMPTIGGWISVKDRLPEENEAVNIVWMNTEPESYYEHIKGKPFVATGVYFHGKWFWWSSVVQDYLAEYGSWEPDEMDDVIVVTHWMPLPEPPKEES